eukprot:14177044-Alexandrium_andersonii.AAC.1
MARSGCTRSLGRGVPQHGAFAPESAPVASQPAPRRLPPGESGRAGRSVPGASAGGSPVAAPRNRAS